MSKFDFWMWERANALLSEVEQLQRELFHPSRSTWQPPVDIFESRDAFLVVVALPGVDPDHVEVLVEGGRQVVRGSRSLPEACQRAIVHRLEIPRGRFERWIDLPAGHYEPGERQVINGCLVFSLKKVSH